MAEMIMDKIAFVTPWYGEDIPGGAESLMRNVISHLAEAGANVEILTTCVKQFSADWNKNYHTPGVSRVGNVQVRRFKAIKRNREHFDYVNFKLMNGQPVSKEDEEVFFSEMVRSRDLEEYLKENKNAYHCFVFAPYMFGTTFWGVRAVKDKAVLLPCLHDESYAYMNLIKEMFALAGGCIFNAPSEQRLANSLYKIDNIPQIVIGTGIDCTAKGNPERFRERYHIGSPFLLYAGRKDKGKNVDQLLQYYSLFRQRNNEISLDLVLIGGGDIKIAKMDRTTIHDLGFLDQQMKVDCFSAAMALCQPSVNESFSIVIMESWMNSRPVIINGECAVTKEFAQHSNGGLYYKNYGEFEGIINYLYKNLEKASIMGANGFRYVNDNFSWPVVTQKYMQFLSNFSSEEL